MWASVISRPRVLAFCGCFLTYEGGTHFFHLLILFGKKVEKEKQICFLIAQIFHDAILIIVIFREHSKSCQCYGVDEVERRVFGPSLWLSESYAKLESN